MNQSGVKILGAEMFSTAEIALENTEIMNKKFEFGFLLLTIPMCLLTLALNMSVLMMLWKTEKTIVNQLMKLDCIVNIVFSCLGTFQQSPFFRSLGMEVFCFPHIMLIYATGIFNRLLPVAIAVFRWVAGLVFRILPYLI